ncbi:ABC transporter substrate-binding protein [Shimia thalassica]|uniref:Leucine-specific-binding protein n=1 Tax=Shimia thalassica TaxID=1715693 RepID=A0A0P1I7E5_9RHOB|nr:ABC transporter substrate-binding protein [Shimia thalassica]PHO03921.1 branched-chain amino acid ABC transporter substrate-binding protein [Rhodobacteraceae bacterium 4F10]MBU2941600.1 ABC transporter substrate-binding protein [Shimia thalassica]MDO6481818.1 ABC transporter substrate-binding protein [Shimia thalassica]MDO6485139.1 ABC transporter substrate-binding protein [Shimia thalassica]MDO6504019.1 ABC transporter substrate-binding protein [Shimia thalassica]
MKKLLMASAAAALMTGAASAEDIKMGVILGFTGPIESLTPAMAAGAEVAMAEVTASGKLMGGASVTPVRADSTCIDAGAATAAAERLITAEGVKGIMGADCSGVTGAVLANVAVPNGMVMISPSATSPALSDAEDNGMFFRTAPSDARQGQVLATVLLERGFKSAALTYTNNDYGKGLADSISAAFKAGGGEITATTAHEDGKADYSAEVAALASAGGDILIVAGYVDQGGPGVIRAALDTGAFETFALPDGMIGTALETNFGDEIEGSIGTVPGSEAADPSKVLEAVAATGADASGPYIGESYDAAALIMLAMQAAGSTDPKAYSAKIMDVANAPGEPIAAGELDKALEILAGGGEIDYVGATAVELIGGGEASGGYREIEIKGGKMTTAQYR